MNSRHRTFAKIERPEMVESRLLHCTTGRRFRALNEHLPASDSMFELR